MKQAGFFDLEDRYAELSNAGDPLEKLANVVNFKTFRYRLNKALQKDTDARWTVKFSPAKAGFDGRASPDLAIPVFGHKSHISIDRRYSLIRKWDISSAAVHDSRKFAHLLDQGNTAREVWADTAYRSRANKTLLAEGGFASRTHRKKPKGKAMSAFTAKANNTKSRIRARAEHAFAVQKGTMRLFIRSIGMAQARTKIGMANLAYNMKRLIYLNARVAPTQQKRGLLDARKPRQIRANQWWSTDMTKVMVGGYGWMYVTMVVDWYTKKVVGHYAGEQSKAWHWLKAL